VPVRRKIGLSVQRAVLWVMPSVVVKNQVGRLAARRPRQTSEEDLPLTGIRRGRVEIADQQIEVRRCRVLSHES
jgi:hypothetical protein